MTVAIKHCPLDCSCRWLAPFDRKLIELLAHGHSNGELARYTRRALPTVKNRLGKLYRRLGVPSRIELVLRAQELGLVDLPDASHGRAVGDPHTHGDHCIDLDGPAGA